MGLAPPIFSPSAQCKYIVDVCKCEGVGAGRGGDLDMYHRARSELWVIVTHRHRPHDYRTKKHSHLIHGTYTHGISWSLCLTLHVLVNFMRFFKVRELDAICDCASVGRSYEARRDGYSRHHTHFRNTPVAVEKEDG